MEEDDGERRNSTKMRSEEREGESTVVCPALGRRHGRPSSPERKETEKKKTERRKEVRGEKEEGVRWVFI